MHKPLRRQPPALAVVDGPHRLFGLVNFFGPRIDRGEIARLDEALAVLEPLGDEPPVPGLFRQSGQVSGDAGAGLLGCARGFQKSFLSVGGVAGHDDEAGQDRAARLQEVAVKIPDQRVAAPSGPHLREGQRGEHAHRDVGAVGVVKREPLRRHGHRPARRGALVMQRIPRRPAPLRAQQRFVRCRPLFAHRRCDEFHRQRQQRVGLKPPRVRAGRGERAFERPSKRAQRGLRGRPRIACQARGDEHPVVRAGERRTPRMQWAPARVAEQPLPALGHDRQQSVLAHRRIMLAHRRFLQRSRSARRSRLPPRSGPC